MKILLVDDEQSIQRMLTNLFTRKGFQVVVADSGATGLTVARRELPDLIISDVMMPDMDGFQFRRATLGDEVLRNIPFVFFSGKYVSDKSRRLAEALGVSRFMKKPAKNEEFFATIVQVLDEHREATLPSPQNEEFQHENFADSYQEVLLERVLESNQALEQAQKVQQVMNNLLHLTLVDLTLPELLDSLLDQIISFPGYELLPKGALFIVEDNELVLMAHRGLHESLLEQCGRFPVGRCLCGRSAESGQIVFADHVDERHDTVYPGIQPHGHYCVPIKTGTGKVLGVFTLYVRAGALYRKDVENSLQNAARTAAAIIIRKMKEEELKQYYDELNALNTASNKLLFRNKEKDPLLSYICHVAYESFHLKMVWLGFIDRENQLTVAASCGEGTEYLDSLLIRCNKDDESEGPSCTAIKTGNAVACNDIEHDRNFLPWRDRAMALGFRSSLAVPLMDVEKGCRGTLNMYSDKKGFFNPERIVLLTAYVNNVVALLDNEKLISNLEQKVLERTAELESARNQAEAADKAKSSFLANMSHELRTPLNSIIGFTDIMLQGLSGELSSEQREYLNDIHESGRHLHSLVNDILDLSKIEADMMELEYSENNITDLVTRCLFMVREKALKHNISITTEISPDLPLVEVDERRIRQVIVNLLSNAVKFTPDGGKVRIVARTYEDEERAADKIDRENGSMLISVIDSGKGIASEDQMKLFKPFVQLDSGMTKEMDGTGLGLALCKRIVEQHNGSISVSSEPGEGSVFSFSIPVRRSSSTKKMPAAFLPWTIFYQHIERILSMASRIGTSVLLLKLDHDERESSIEWSEIVVAFTGQMRTHEFFSREPAEGVFYFLLICDDSVPPDAYIARLENVLRKIDIAPSFHQAIYPEDGWTAFEILSSLGYQG